MSSEGVPRYMKLLKHIGHAFQKAVPSVTAGIVCSVLVLTVMDKVTSRLPYEVNMLRDMDIGSAECRDSTDRSV